jgi:hypothetical protein
VKIVSDVCEVAAAKSRAVNWIMAYYSSGRWFLEKAPAMAPMAQATRRRATQASNALAASDGCRRLKNEGPSPTAIIHKWRLNGLNFLLRNMVLSFLLKTSHKLS